MTGVQTCALPILILEEVFNIDNKYILSAKKERVDKQYYVDLHITKEEVWEMIKEAEKFNKKIYDLIEKLQSKNIKEYCEKYTKI